MSQIELPPSIALVGPTGVGKTELSLHIARHFSCEIISVDSMQVYRHMDIGTAKATPEERQAFPHHVIDIADPDEVYNVARFVDDAVNAAYIIRQHNKIPLLAGGTGLYLKGLTEGIFEMDRIDPDLRRSLKKRLQEEGREVLHAELRRHDPASAERLHPNDTQRVLRALEIVLATGKTWVEHLAGHNKQNLLPVMIKIGLMCEREELYRKINTRTGKMMAAGFLNEVQSLLDMGYDSSLNSMQAIGYRHLANYLEGRWSLDMALELLARDTRRYAKRQLTWFQRDKTIRWFAPSNTDEIIAAIESSMTLNRERQTT